MQSPTWLDFADRPVAAVDVVAPAIELASVLRRYREDVDAAARAGVEGRTQSLRALADQAVLAAELETMLDPARTRWSVEPTAGLTRLKDEMLGRIRAAGLQIVRLVGMDADAVSAIADVDAWQFDDALAGEVVLEELEVAVLYHGVPLRRGRVVMGAPPAGGPKPDDVAVLAPPHAAPPAPPRSARPVPIDAQIICPVPDCGTENDAAAEVCVACLTQLGGYARLSLFPRMLFNRGLEAARTGDNLTARDCFAAVVLWHPEDLESRNAYALACLQSRDLRGAREAWRAVLLRSPADAIARAGLHALRCQ